ncbi:multicopper oxidase family protein [Dactylosporangium sucinum]|uniref:Multicopper oxidase n=1 Tax=Dactylosporangium sucinum TaxID=1424081 RepID=A0A917X5U8_9ACTN|nr:multicopper oxidase domain-containing protein [Dactylosporangium sucinum]GGM74268.1 multicopper oxidase [Dactylosporangium sucinum]
MRRRTLLRRAGTVAAAVLAPAVGVGGWLYVSAGRGNVGELSFRNRLRIPPLLPPRVDGRRLRFRLTAGPGLADLLPGRRTPAWGYNGAYLGPTLRARRGDTVVIDVENRLPVATSTHWHGMRLPAIMDGGPHQPIAPGATWSPTWTIDQPPGTLWYHPHLHGSTAEHVYRGLAGLFLVVDDDRLPSEYGVDDVPVVLQDKKFHDDAAFDTNGLTFGGLSITGLLGDTILVNGTYDPFVEVTRTLTRFRLLNASNARVYDVGFADNRPMSVVATDAGLLPAPVPATRIMLSPGERAEVVVGFTAGERVVLRSHPPALHANPVYERFAGGDDTFDLLQVRAAARLEPAPPLPDTLAAEDAARPGPNATARTFVLGDFTINGVTMDHVRIDQIVRPGAVEVWAVTNAGGFPSNGVPHNFHIHGVDFAVLDVAGARPPAHLRGPKDTVFVPPRTTVRLAVRFAGYSDPHHPYMYHCHFLAHEDAGMMGQFLVASERT